MASILVIDDDWEWREILCEDFEAAGHQVCTAANREEALLAVSSFRPDGITCDGKLKEFDDGLTLAQEIREITEVPIVMFSTFSAPFEGKHLRKREYNPTVLLELLGL